MSYRLCFCGYSTRQNSAQAMDKPQVEDPLNCFYDESVATPVGGPRTIHNIQLWVRGGSRVQVSRGRDYGCPWVVFKALIARARDW